MGRGAVSATRLARTAIVATTIAMLAACQVAGPDSIERGRGSYNEVLHQTSDEQVLSNIVRVAHKEPTFIMDVTEVDAALLVQGSLTGGVANVGARPGTSGGTIAGQTGAVNTTLEYQESPTIRYQPLLGAPLIAQLSTPVNVDSLAAMSDSDWPLAAIAAFAVNYLTPNFEDKHLALNAILQLDSYGALLISAAKSDLTTLSVGGREFSTKIPSAGPPPATTAAAGGAAPPAPPNDSLVLYLQPSRIETKGSVGLAREKILRLWLRLLTIYDGTQPMSQNGEWNEDLKSEIESRLSAADDKMKNMTEEERRTFADKTLNHELDHWFNKLPNWLEIRTAPLPSAPAGCSEKGRKAKCRYLGPLMRTHSALGILKAATEQSKALIEFISPADYGTISAEPQNKDSDEVYTLRLADIERLEGPLKSAESKKTATCVDEWIKDWIKAHESKKEPYLDGLPYNFSDTSRPVCGDLPEYQAERQLAHLRRYILVIKSPDRPVSPNTAFAPIEYGGEWYYIDNHDKISKNNFSILSLFLTIMAIPSPTPPLTPTIPVGGRTGS